MPAEFFETVYLKFQGEISIIALIVLMVFLRDYGKVFYAGTQVGDGVIICANSFKQNTHLYQYQARLPYKCQRHANRLHQDAQNQDAEDASISPIVWAC